MDKIRLITDSASDISYEDEKKYNIRVLPFEIVLGDKSYVSRVDFDNEGFYQLMAQYDEIPKTSQITPFAFQELFLEEAQNGYTDLILVLINSGGSATHGNAVMAKDLFFDEHPEFQDKVRIHIFDGIGYSAFYGYTVVNAGRMMQEGKTVDEITSYLEETLGNRRLYFGMYTLKYAGKSGRIPSAAAFLGDKLNLKPVMKISDNTISTAAKVRGEGKLAGRIVNITMAEMEPGSPYQIVYGSDKSTCDEMVDLMTKKLGYGPDACYQIGAAVAANSGPKVTGIAFNLKKSE